MSQSAVDDELNTSIARAEILGRIRTLQGRPDSFRSNEVAQAQAYMDRHERGPGPSAVDNLVELFVERSKAMLCSVARVPSFDHATRACASYIAEHQLQGIPAIWPSLASLDWAAAGLKVRVGSPGGGDLIGISGVAYAVAETGTLVFASRPDEPASTHLLPETHIALVSRAQVVHTMEDAFARLREDGRAMPRALNFVSGPSRTADIEQTIVLGAHGPYRVHLVLVG
ncbi:MAG TPA: lactate utilization protein C [Limnobacter sp.]|nr:lactate utilization protein C [Limnobacter sp.]